MNEHESQPLMDSFGSKNLGATPADTTTALCIAVSVLGAIGAATAPFVILPLVRGQNLPYMATPKRKLQKAFTFLKQYHQNQSNNGSTKHRRFVDLGSGDGETVYQALSLLKNTSSVSTSNIGMQPHYYYSQCIGVELNSTLYIWSCIRRFFWNYDTRNRSRFLCRDFFHPGNDILEDVNTVFIFGIPSLMTPISQLLRRNCRQGTFILCYRFPLPVVNVFSEDEKMEDSSKQLLSAQLIYDQEEMRIYECIDN